jgi:hypothetical protein
MEKHFIFSLIILFLFIKYSQTNLNITNEHFKIICGIDRKKSKAKIYNFTQSQSQLESHFRKLTDDDYKPIRIYVSKDVISFLSNLPGFNNQILDDLDEVMNYIPKLINVKYIDYPIKIEYQTIIDKKIFLGQQSNPTYDKLLVNGVDNCDLVIIPMIDLSENGYIYSENLLRDNTTKRVIASIINIPNSLIQKLNNRNFNHYTKSILIHLMTHILGFEHESFEYFPGGLEKTIRTDVSRGINRTYIITPKVVELVKEYYNIGQILVEAIYKDGIMVSAKCFDKQGHEVNCRSIKMQSW